MILLRSGCPLWQEQIRLRDRVAAYGRHGWGAGWFRNWALLFAGSGCGDRPTSGLDVWICDGR